MVVWFLIAINIFQPVHNMTFVLFHPTETGENVRVLSHFELINLLSLKEVKELPDRVD